MSSSDTTATTRGCANTQGRCSCTRTGSRHSEQLVARCRSRADDILQKWCQCVCGGFSLRKIRVMCCAGMKQSAIILQRYLKVPSSVVYAAWRSHSCICHHKACVKWKAQPFNSTSGKQCVLRATWHLQNQTRCAQPGDGEAWHTVDERQLCSRSFYVETLCTLPVTLQLFRAAFMPNKSVNRKQLVEWLSHDVERGVDVQVLVFDIRSS